MSKVMFTITYTVKPQMRTAYLKTIQALKEHLVDVRGKDYSVFEHKSKPNHFTEVYFCKDWHEYELLDDDSDEIVQALVEKIMSEFIYGGKTEYATLVENDSIN